MERKIRKKAAEWEDTLQIYQIKATKDTNPFQ